MNEWLKRNRSLLHYFISEGETMKFAKVTFFVAALYGIIALSPLYFAEKFLGRLFPPAITHPEFFYGFLGVVIVFHLVFLVISKDPARYRPLMLLGAAEKFVFGVPTVLLYVQGRVPLPIVIAAAVDLAFGVLFLIAYRKTSEAASAAWQTA
jgi:hypothetical protein